MVVHIHNLNPGKTEAWGSQGWMAPWLRGLTVLAENPGPVPLLRSQGSTALFWPPWGCTIHVGKIVMHRKQNEYFKRSLKRTQILKQ